MNILYLPLVLLLVSVWGFNFVIIKFGLEGIPPILLACIRFFFTSIPAIFFIKRPNAPFFRVMLYGLVLFAGQFSFFFMGLDLGVPAGLAAILMQIHVFVSLLLATFAFGEPIKPLQIIGATISFSGITYAACNVAGSFSLLGFFCVIAGGMCWGLGSAISKTLGKVNMVSLVVWGSMMAWPPLLLLSLILEGPREIISSLTHINLHSTGVIFYLTYVATLFGYSLWSFLISRQPLSSVVPFTLLVPIIAMISCSLILGEPLQTWKILSSLLVLGGLSLTFLQKKPSPTMDETS